MRTSIIAALVCVLWLGGLDITLGQPNKALYELKERCGKVAREYFAKEHGQDVDKSRDGEMKLKFENHYSTRLLLSFDYDFSRRVKHGNDDAVRSKRQ